MTSMPNGSRVALVTGAARGIGRAIALRLAGDGLDVAINDLAEQRRELDLVAEGIGKAGVRSCVVTADVSEAAAVQQMVDEVVRDLGQLDVMVANAGIAQVTPLLDLSSEDWDRMMAINARGVFLCYQAAARQMVRQGHGGKIIGAASIAAHKGFALLGHYSASKWAVRALTQAAAQEWGEHGITVNAYCPGIVDTAMWEQIDEQIGALRGLDRGEAMGQYADSSPSGACRRLRTSQASCPTSPPPTPTT